MRSLLAPLTLGLVLSLVVVFGVQWSMVRVAIDSAMQNYIAAGLAQDADELFGALSIQPGGEASLALSHFDPPFVAPSSGQYYQIPAGQRGCSSLPSLVYGSLPLTPAGPGSDASKASWASEGQALLLSASGYASMATRSRLVSPSI
jgi:hypothetical protein